MMGEVLDSLAKNPGGDAETEARVRAEAEALTARHPIY